ncbi:MAG TPA: hypothetical protein VIM35_05035 [Gallionella sp.]
MRSSFIFGIIVISAFLLEGCGHKGPLMLPTPPARTSQAPTPIVPASGVPASQPGK